MNIQNLLKRLNCLNPCSGIQWMFYPFYITDVGKILAKLVPTKNSGGSSKMAPAKKSKIPRSKSKNRSMGMRMVQPFDIPRMVCFCTPFIHIDSTWSSWKLKVNCIRLHSCFHFSRRATQWRAKLFQPLSGFAKSNPMAFDAWILGRPVFLRVFAMFVACWTLVSMPRIFVVVVAAAVAGWFSQHVETTMSMDLCA